MPDEKTPPAVLITKAEKGLVRRAVRVFVKTLAPHLPAIAKFGATALVPLLLSSAHTWSEKAETRRQIRQKAAEVSKQAADKAVETTDRALEVVVPRSNEISEQLTAALKRIEALEVATKAQSAVIVAREHDFVVVGRPAHHIDPGLVKVVKANAARDSKELEARKRKPVVVLKPLPLELPPASAGGAGGAPSITAHVQPPPVIDAGHSQ